MSGEIGETLEVSDDTVSEPIGDTGEHSMRDGVDGLDEPLRDGESDVLSLESCGIRVLPCVAPTYGSLGGRWYCFGGEPGLIGRIRPCDIDFGSGWRVDLKGDLLGIGGGLDGASRSDILETSRGSRDIRETSRFEILCGVIMSWKLSWLSKSARFDVVLVLELPCGDLVGKSSSRMCA